MQNWWKPGISRITEKKHSGNAELAEETGENVRGNCGCLENQGKKHFQTSPVSSAGSTFQNAFSLLSWISPVSTSSAFPEYFFLFSQTSPVSPPLAPHSQNVFSCFPRHPLFPLLAPHFQNAFSLLPWISPVSTHSTFLEFFPPDIPSSLHWLHTSRMLFLSFSKHLQFPPVYE